MIVVNKNIAKKDKKKILIAASIVLVLVLSLLGATFAYFVWVGDESSIDVSVSSGTGSCTLLEDNKVELIPTTAKENGRIVKLKARQSLATTARITWNIKVNSLGGLNHNTFKYELVDTTTNTNYGSGNFGSVPSTSSIPLSNNELLARDTDYTFTLYLWIDGNEENPSTMAKQNFDFDISCDIIGATSN